MDNYNYTMESDISSAPWNQVEYPEKEIEVTVSITLSKTLKINVDDYEVEEGRDEDGDYYLDINFDNCDLKKAVREQYTLPNELSSFTTEMFNQDLNLKAVGMPRYLKNAIIDCKDWNVDDFEIIKE